VQEVVREVVAEVHEVSKEDVEAFATPAVTNGRRLYGGATRWNATYSLIVGEDRAQELFQKAQDIWTRGEAKQVLGAAFVRAKLQVNTADVVVKAEVKDYEPCFDNSLGAKDPFEDGCDAYRRNPGLCGTSDDEDFTAADMCCSCNGGSTADPGDPADTTTAGIPVEPGCKDGDIGLDVVDRTGDGCDVYEMDPVRFCGSFDDDDFDANMLCCACGKPLKIPAPAPPPSTKGPVLTDAATYQHKLAGSALMVVGSVLLQRLARE